MACKSVMLKPYDVETYILPFGFVQLPIISSLCLFNSSLGNYLHNSGINVSVYMDDIIISISSSFEEAKLFIKMRAEHN